MSYIFYTYHKADANKIYRARSMMGGAGGNPFGGAGADGASGQGGQPGQGGQGGSQQ